MPASVSDRLGSVPLRSVKAELRTSEGDVQKLKRDAAEALDIARSNARLELKEIAGVLRLSHSLIARGFNGAGELSFHRLWELSDEFWAELLIAIAKKRAVATVKTSLDIHDRKVG